MRDSVAEMGADVDAGRPYGATLATLAATGPPLCRCRITATTLQATAHRLTPSPAR